MANIWRFSRFWSGIPRDKTGLGFTRIFSEENPEGATSLGKTRNFLTTLVANSYINCLTYLDECGLSKVEKSTVFFDITTGIHLGEGEPGLSGDCG